MRKSTIAGLVLLVTASLAPAGLVAVADGWQMTGATYTAKVSPTAGLTSLSVAGFEFLGAAGLYVADGDKTLPFATIAVDGDRVTMANDQATVTLDFQPEAVVVAIENRAIVNGHCLRLAIVPTIVRAKSQTGVDLSSPLKGHLYKPSRLIAPDGQTLTLAEPGSYNLLAGGQLTAGEVAHTLSLGYTSMGTSSRSTIGVRAELPIEDALRVQTRCAHADFTFWGDGPAELTSAIANLRPGGAFDGHLTLRLVDYVTKAVVREERRPLTLAAAAQIEQTWRIDGVPPMLYIAEMHASEGADSGLVAAPRFVYRAGAIAPPEPPVDFDSFWERTLREQAAIPLDLRIEKVREDQQHDVYTFDFAGLLGYRCYGWLTIPRERSGPLPGVLVLPPAGNRSQPVPLFKDAVGMAININGQRVDGAPGDYDIHTWPAHYLVTGIMDKDHYSLRFGYAATVRAAEVLAARPEVDAAKLRVQGSSQGGGLTIVAAGLFDGFVQADARKPGLCRLDWNHDYLQPPYFPIATNVWTHDAIATTLRYYLPSHFARRIRCPITISLGLYDDVTPAVGVFCAFNAIPGDAKKLTVDPAGAH